MHSLKNRRYGNNGWVALKLDMAKAYDRIEWSYLEAVLRKFGFADQWVRWVMACVTTVSFATVVNGEKGEFFTPSRGIRQGCPLSPYLFILCAEGFHYLIQKEIEEGSLHGIQIGRHCPSISHLFFADDSVLFWEAFASGCHAIDNILRKYEGASGQMVNKDKSSLFFSPNTPDDVKKGISEFLHVRIELQGGKYLGLPSIIGKSKTGVFNYIKDRVNAKLRSWDDSVLNMVGREVMLNTVLLTMPNYVMNCFLLPKRVCKELCSTIRKFWWGSKEGEKKICWVSWDKLCEHKRDGGLGFRDLHSLNLAFLAKQGWKLLHEPNSLFQRLFKGKYFHNSSFWEAGCPNSASWAWHSIVAGRPILKKGWRWNVGNGASIDIWKDPWLPRSLSFKVLSRPPLADSPYSNVHYVSELINGTTHEWNIPLLKSLFSDLDVETILSVPISYHGLADKGLLHYTSNGMFSVKSAYNLAKLYSFPRNSRERGESSSGTSSDSFWKSLWAMSIPNKIKMFVWRCSHNAVAVLHNLTRKNVEVPPDCPRCHAHRETLEHLIFQCKYSKELWLISPFSPAVSDSWSSLSFVDWWSAISHFSPVRGNVDDMSTLLASLCWFIWKARNKVLFDGRVWSCASVLEKAMASCSEFKDASLAKPVSPTTQPPEPVLVWNPPPPTIIKFNVDGATNKEEGVVGVGIVARDHLGQILGASSVPFTGFFSPRSVEAMGFREALVIAANKGISNIIVEGDCAQVVQALTQARNLFSDCNSILSDCLELLPLFSSCKFVHVKRYCNRVAHSLARQSLFSGKLEFWGGPVPQWLANFATIDVRSSDRAIV